MRILTGTRPLHHDQGGQLPERSREKQEHEDSGHAVYRSWCAACVEDRGLVDQVELTCWKNEKENNANRSFQSWSSDTRKRRHVSNSDLSKQQVWSNGSDMLRTERSHEVKNYAIKFLPRRWTLPGPGSEESYNNSHDSDSSSCLHKYQCFESLKLDRRNSSLCQSAPCIRSSCELVSSTRLDRRRGRTGRSSDPSARKQDAGERIELPNPGKEGTAYTTL